MGRGGRQRMLKLAAVGTAGGFFSGLLGVGGGTVIVPLLVLWLAYDERTASGTSLLAIVAIAGIGATLQAVYGNVHPAEAALVGLPAVGGVLAGTALQQRLATPTLSLLFAGLLVVVAVKLLVG
jgi:uncharacterized membrane protein YfcA